jgi:hypothetical protein
MPDLPSTGLPEVSLMTLSLSVSPGSVAKLGAQSYQLILRGYLLLTQMSSRPGTQSSVALPPPFPLIGYHGYLTQM